MGVLPYGSGVMGRCEATVGECECVCGTCDSYLHACHVALAVVKGAWPGPASSSSRRRLLFLLFLFVCFFLYTHIGISSTEQGYLESFVFILLFSLTLD